MDPTIQLAHWARTSKRNHDDFVKAIQADIIAAPMIDAPIFGNKKSTYTDWFASGKPLKTLENIMTESVLPYYANTHTTTTSSARHTTQSVKWARETISRCLNTTPEEAAVIFCGDGSTTGINRVRNLFRLGDLAFWARKALAESIPDPSSSTSTMTSTAAALPSPSELLLLSLLFSSDHTSPFAGLPAQHRPVVFLSIQEHHSNLLPFRESVAEVVVIGENAECQLDLVQLERELILYQDRPLKLGSFSAGSNLTGVLNDTVAIAEMLHKYGGYAFFDYAGVGPYTTIDMNPSPSKSKVNEGPSMAYKDGVFISPHKFIGGPGSSGILCARNEIFEWAEHNSSTSRNELFPVAPGGGTVDMVICGKHKYVHNILATQEAGTPNILATIRAGLVFHLQELADPAWILFKEQKLAGTIYNRLLSQPAISVLGSPLLDRVAVFSLTMSVPRLSTLGRPLHIHYSLLSTIMNDFFGIEMRGGCMCAGPYASQLLKFDADKEEEFWRLLLGDETKSSANLHQQGMVSLSLKPGFVRFSFSYFARPKDVEFVLQSLDWVAQYGFLLIPLYKIDAHSGKWSVRESVHQVLLKDVQPKKLENGLRKDYIPIATECIYGLQRLFKLQDKMEASSAQPPVASTTTKPPGVFYSISQARKSLHTLWTGTTKGQSQAGPPSHQRPPILPLPHKVRTSAFYESMSDSGQEDGLVSIPATPDLSSSGFASRQSISDDRTSVHSVELASTTTPSVTDDSTATIPKTRTRSSSAPVPPPKSLISAAMKELSMARLEEELATVEQTPLAKQLRWFVSPLEVAQLYRSELECSHPSSFPRRS